MENRYYQLIGISNGEEFILLDYDLSNNTGLIDSKEHGGNVWCTFEEIRIEYKYPILA